MNINFNEKRYILLEKGTSNKSGLIRVTYTRSLTCYADFCLYCSNTFITDKTPSSNGYIYGQGKAGGYGYDKESSAIAQAIQKAGLKTAGALRDTPFSHYPFASYADHEAELSAYCRDNQIIPVYAGTGQHKEALELFFDVIEC
jgi:hypothetical protein